MSISEPSRPRGSPPLPPSYNYPRQSPDPNRYPQPTLPSVSYLLTQEQRSEVAREAQHHPEPQTQYIPTIARQFLPPYNMIKQHPLSLSELDPNAPKNAESILVPTHHTLAVSPQGGAAPPRQRQFKKIVQRQQDPVKGHEAGPSSRNEGRKGRSPPQEERARMSSHTEPTVIEPVRRFSSQNQSSRSVPISGLLSERPSTPEAPRPTYSIRMRQQPLSARACGFGERDRRVVDPPPILQMDVDAPNATPEELKALIRQPYAVVHCTLWDPVTDKDATAMPGTTDKRQQRRLMGTLVASPFVGNDENEVEGCFFCFPDLSVRTPGIYSLMFKLVTLNPSTMGPGHVAPVRSTVTSTNFTVLNAKDFGGMRASTELTKKLKHQGCLISVKKGNAKSNGKNDREDDDEDEEDDEDDLDEGSNSKGKRPAKRPKR